MHDCMPSAHENFRPCPLFFQPRPFKALFFTKNDLLCGSINLFTIENDAKATPSQSLVSGPLQFMKSMRVGSTLGLQGRKLQHYLLWTSD